MEKGLYQPAVATVSAGASIESVETNWRHALPVLTSAGVTLRELELSDAPALLAMLTTEEVTRFISPPPTTIEGFERFITWTRQQRAAGSYICFAVVPTGCPRRSVSSRCGRSSSDFSTAEWGFALGSAFWGTGAFSEGARLVIDFAFDTVGVHRLEARASVENGRGNGALRKLGAVQEGLLRRAFLKTAATTTRCCGPLSTRTGKLRI